MKQIKLMAIAGLIAAVLGGVLPLQAANAQFIQTGSGQTSGSGSSSSLPYPGTSGCVSINSFVTFGSRDYYSGGEVSKVQNFLISKGYLQAGLATGYYGRMTFSAMQQFQASNGIQPTGGAGPITRAKIRDVSCGSVVNPPTNGAPVITSMSPTSGPVGTMVTVYGSGFTSTNNIVIFGNSGSVPYVVSSNGTSLTFRVPESLTPACYYGNPACYIAMMARATTPGQYAVSIQNSRGTSNSINFNVTSGSINNPNGAPVITGVDTPTNLQVGQTGTWSIRALDPSGSGLSYSVSWGDENTYSGSGYYIPYSGGYTQNSTFTHVYYSPGTYTAKFTVRSSNGMTAETTQTITVGSNGNNYVPTITSISPTSGPFGTVVTITGMNFDRYNNSVNFANVNNVARNVESTDGRTLQFTVPATPCSSGSICAQVALQNGTYGISVTNSNGTSNVFNYTVSATTGNNVDQTIVARINESVYVGDLMIMPTSIGEDSRCPVDVTCIQAGKIVVNTQLRGPSTQINTALSYGSSNTLTRVDGYSIQIVGVQPSKTSTQTIPYYNYAITYRVTR